ncbi:MAG: hypothetical protein Q8P17_05520 [bacterium]|nr:hypothetical protein [bacterium]
MRILITGIAGSGKTTIIAELRARGHNAIDLDNCGVCAWIHKETGERAEYVEGAGKEWIENHRWQVITPKLTSLLKDFPVHQDVFVGGKIAKIQARELADVFDVIYLLRPHDSVVDERLATRTTNAVNFGKKKEERDSIIGKRDPFEAACIEVGAVPLENHGTSEELIARILTR